MIRIYHDWETEARGPRAATPVELIECYVAHVKDNGFKDDLGVWHNWSKFADQRLVTMPRVGETVRVSLDKAGYIRQLAVVTPQTRQVGSPAPAELAPATIDALRAARQTMPSQPEKDPAWLTGEGYDTEPSAPAEARIAQNERETVITRLAVLKAAAEASAGMPTADILAQAAAFESWVLR